MQAVKASSVSFSAFPHAGEPQAAVAINAGVIAAGDGIIGLEITQLFDTAAAWVEAA